MHFSLIKPKAYLLEDLIIAISRSLKVKSVDLACSIAVVKLYAYSSFEDSSSGKIIRLRVEDYLLDLFSKPDEWQFIFRATKKDGDFSLCRCYLNGVIFYRTKPKTSLNLTKSF